MSRRPAGNIWFHGASVGDARALQPLVAGVQAARPELSHVYSAQTRTGRSMWGELVDPTRVVAPPIDVAPWPRRALEAVGCRLLVLEYLELWPTWVGSATALGIPVVVVDGRVTHRSLRIRRVLRRCAGQIAWFSAQTSGDAERAIQLGVRASRITVDGNGKYDRSDLRAPAPTLTEFGDYDVVLGSLHPDEERAALESLAAAGLRAIIAPRYPKRTPAIERRARALGVRCARRSAGPDPIGRWLILDTIGELAGAYARGKVAVMGGTFGRRDGQNLIEAAAQGRPVVFGPRTGNVALEATALAGRGGWAVSNWSQAWRCAQARIQSPGPDPRPALAELRGATARRLPRLLAVLDAPRERC